MGMTWARVMRLKSACTAAPAGRVDGRAATACLLWKGVALPCLCGGSCPGLFFREGEGATASFRPLRLCVRKVVFVDEHTNMVVTTTTT